MSDSKIPSAAPKVMGSEPNASSASNSEALGGDAPAAQLPPAGEVVNDGRKPIESVLYQCRRTFYFAFFNIVPNFVVVYFHRNHPSSFRK